MFGNRIANFAIQSCDLLIILGSRLSVPITGYQIKNFSPNSKKVYIDIDKFEIKKRGLKTDISINTDLNFFLEKLKTYLKKKNEVIFIPLGSVHRIQNNYKTPLKIIEAQVGSILKETDIVRLQDIYGRIK